MIAQGSPISEEPIALLQVLLQPLAYEQLAQAAVDALPGAFAPENAVLGALLVALDSESYRTRALAFTRGAHHADLIAVLGGRPLGTVAGDFRRQSNLIEQVAVQQRPVEGEHLRSFLGGYVDEVQLDRLETVIGWKGGFAVPVPVQERQIAVLLYALAKPATALSAAERASMTTVAHFIGLALEQARLAAAERRRDQEAAALHRLSLHAATADDTPAVLEEVLAAVQTVLHADYAALNTIASRPGEQSWSVRQGYRSPPEIQSTIHPPGTGLAGRAMRSRAPVVIEEFGVDPAFPIQEFPVHTSEGMQSGIGVPLLRPADLHGGSAEAFGALVIGYRQRQYFTREQISLAMALAQEAAFALERARLFALERRRAAELEATFQTVSQPMAIVDRDGSIVRANPAMAELLGTPGSELIGMTPDDFIRRFQVTSGDGQPLPVDRLPVVRAIRGDSVREHLLLHRGESSTPVECAAIATPLTSGGEAGAVLLLRDIGPELRRQRDLEALVESNRRLSAEIDQASVVQAIAAAAADLAGADDATVGVVESPTEGRQAAARRHLFREWYQAPNRRALPHDRHAWDDAAKRALASGTVVIAANGPADGKAAVKQARGEAGPTGTVLALPIRCRDVVLAVVVLVNRRDGPDLDADRIAVLRAFAEEAASVLDNARLYEEERRARRDLERAQEQGQAFLRVVAHELKTPLTNILGYAQLNQRLQARKPATADARSEREERFRIGLEKIVDNCRRLQRLVDELQEAFRLGSGRFTLVRGQVDLNALLAQVAEEQRAVAPAHQITVSLPNEPVVGEVDAERVRQVVTNLLSNAIKYSPDGGPVGLTLRQDNGAAVVRVTDRGLGIPAADMSALFQPYSRLHVERSIKGTGLGLYIVRGIVEAHGGTVRAESAGEGKGAAFVVTIPLHGDATDQDRS